MPVSDRRTRLDFARCTKELVEVHHPQAERMVLVMDQLNAHSPASLDAAFPAAEAKRLADTLEVDYTPKRGSWPTIAELEPSVPERRATAWVAQRSAAASDWTFTAADARTKLRRLHPAS